MPATGPTPANQPEALAVPGDHGLGCDDDQCTIPAGPQPTKENPEDSVACPKSRVLLIPLVDHELLTHGQVLQREVGPEQAGGS